jgi:hypothetical protein
LPVKKRCGALQVKVGPLFIECKTSPAATEGEDESGNRQLSRMKNNTGEKKKYWEDRRYIMVKRYTEEPWAAFPAKPRGCKRIRELSIDGK